MIYALQVHASPYANHSGLDAYQFASAAVAAGHQINQVFFYRDGIYHALRYATPPDDETAFNQQWSQLAAEHGVDLVICISAAQRRGLLCADEAQRQGKQDDDIAAGFRIGGLGLWLEAVLQADRHLVFA
jgi:tRNA 2-thiouridine synthesizing protein D